MLQDCNRLTDIIIACIIMHNMIDVDEGENGANMDFGDNISSIPICQIIHDMTTDPIGLLNT